jgi:hypothetical protein
VSFSALLFDVEYMPVSTFVEPRCLHNVISWEFLLLTTGGNVNGVAPWTDMARNPKVINILGPVWLWMIAKAWDLLGYSRTRYSEFFGNAKNWKDEATPEENLSSQCTSWCPGMPIPTTEDAKEILTPLLA